MNKQSITGAALIITLIIVVLAGSRLYVSVPAGHVAVATLFGEVVDKPYEEGLTFPVNPLYEFTFYDIREKELKERFNAFPPTVGFNKIYNFRKDHRIFMMSCIAALTLGGNFKIYDKMSINSSFPNFLDLLKKLGAKFDNTQLN